ncbi:hypothetical protein [Nocardiopsis valliformis]|uniref:hypothetical protein n=1 Tax=Nocardiopsis valliformis TaxID=239974 RepID=UPI00034D7B04|nr:hypothetical protein [Nocardiopsis valliformis]
MTTRTAVLISWGTLAFALVALITGIVTQNTAWWLWVIWGGLAVGVATLHILARRADLM